MPDDGRFHIMLSGEVVASFKTERAAKQRYIELRDARRAELGYETGWKPPEPAELTRKLRAEHDLQAVIRESRASKWGKATRKGGKSQGGGV